MKHKQNRIIVYILFVLVATSCRDKITEPFQVTYEVKVHCRYPHRVLIIYEDSLGYARTTTDTSWTKTVTLPPDIQASIGVYEFENPVLRFSKLSIFEQLHYVEHTDFNFSVSIINAEKTVQQTGSSSISLRLSQRDIIIEKQSIWKKYNPFWLPPEIDLERYEERRRKSE